MLHQNEGVKQERKQLGTLRNRDKTLARDIEHPEDEGAGKRHQEQFPQKKFLLSKHLKLFKVLRGNLYD